MYNLLILVLATYGASKLLVEYDGFGDVLYKLRNRAWLKALTCVVCTSVWVATLLSLLLFFGQYWIVTVLAIVGTVILIEEMTA